jgi:hypothetical protein
VCLKVQLNLYITRLDHELQIETYSMQRVTENSQTIKTHNQNPFVPRLGKIDHYSAKLKPILSILESAKSKPSCIELKKGSNFQKEERRENSERREKTHSTERERLSERRRSFCVGFLKEEEFIWCFSFIVYLCNKPICLLIIGCCKRMGLRTDHMVGAILFDIVNIQDVAHTFLFASALFYFSSIFYYFIYISTWYQRLYILTISLL